MWDLSSPTGIEPVPPALEGRSHNHWTATEVPGPLSLDSGVLASCVPSPVGLGMQE